MSTHKAKVQSQFGAVPEAYATSDVHAHGESLQVLLTLCAPEPSWQVLDVATGAGHTALAFAPHVGRVVAADLTQPMLTKTMQLANDRRLHNVVTVKADAEQLPFQDASFDLVTCRLAYHHFAAPERALSEMVRVLKPAAALGFTDNIVVDDAAAAEYYNEYEKLRDPSHHRVVSIAELERRFAGAGLQVLHLRELSKEFEFHEWADRQRVTQADKQRLIAMMRAAPPALQPLFRPRWTEATLYFSLREAVIIAKKAASL